jgi:hypothetical protein
MPVVGTGRDFACCADVGFINNITVAIDELDGSAVGIAEVLVAGVFVQ